ncbi:MAG: hypothetical protein O7B30_03305 [Thaumarchaeota archaeon]|nr:hypothetical protein [Nitrososphaerota archaeon]
MESAFAPAHITGILEVPPRVHDPLSQGSLGAGFSIERGVTTEVRTRRDSASSIRVRINGSPPLSAEVSELVARRMMQMMGSNHEILIDHFVRVPIGAGYGSSGSAGLSLALALNESLGLGLTITEAAQIAHLAEIECGTGLGTVLAELYGGPEIRISSGAPGIGKISKFHLGRKSVAGTICFGPLETKHVISNPELVRKINLIGRPALQRLLKDPSVDLFLELSRKFSVALGLMSDRLLGILNYAESCGLICGMGLFGETLFSLITEDSRNEFDRIVASDRSFETLPSRPEIIFSRIDNQGARLL